jgi:arginine-tRNA-protein transferase
MQELIEPPRVCSYLPLETAALAYRFCAGLAPADLEELIRRGWRRFGTQIFRPACAHCVKCVPTRVAVSQFRPSKSQRRVLRRNSHIEVSLHPAEVSNEHVQLYNAWHQQMTQQRRWRRQRHSLRGYAESFLLGDFPSAHELRYFSDGRMVGVGLIDILPHAVSSAYFYHDPGWRELGPGTFSLMCEIELACRLGLDWLYLGYWIAECPSMSYKNRFDPHEVLLNRPTDEEIPEWVAAEHAAGGDVDPAADTSQGS